MEESYNDDIRSQLRARLKKEIIQNNIYGVDIEEGAIEIARLRFWLSIVIDLDKPEALPNFDYKFMQGNSLLESYQFDVESENDNEVKKKKSVSIDLSKICEKEQVENVNNNGVAIQFEEGNKEREDLMALLREYYGETGHENKKELRGKIEKQVRVLLNAKFFQTHGNAINAMPLICDKFFLWHLWFKDVFDRGGFDIVIGNPPYFQMPKGVVDANKYPYSEGKDPGKQNIYKLFIELAYNFLRETGVNSFITQSSLMCDASAQYTRELLLKNTTLYQVIEFPKVAPHKEGQVFKGALVGTCIYLYAKMPFDVGHKFKLSANNDLTTIYHFDFAELHQSEPLSFYPGGYCFPLIRKMQFDIIAKMNKGTKYLNNYMVENTQGDFNLSTEKKYYGTNVTSVKVYRGCHIHRYYMDDLVSEYAQESYKQDKVHKNMTNLYLVCQGVTGMTDKNRFHFSFSRQVSCLYGHSVNKVLLIPICNIKMMLGILNSKLIDWYFRRTSTNNNINSYELEQLPIPIVSSARQQEIITIVDKILAIKNANPTTDTTKYERQIDALVYELYGITDYNELLEIEGDRQKALEMLILITHYRNPNATDILPLLPEGIASSDTISIIANMRKQGMIQ